MRVSKKLLGVAVAGLLAGWASGAQADYINGTIAVGLFPSSYTGSSLADATSISLGTGYFQGGSDDFASVPIFDLSDPSGLVTTSPLTGTFDATSTQSAYVPDSVSSLFVFGGSNGTEYDFNLSALSELNTAAGLTLYGQGSLVDTTGGAETTPATFTLAGLTDYGSGSAVSGSFTLTAAAVPEPATVGLLGIAGVAMLARRRRA